ncbi:MAG: hypothetical protein ACOCZQ_03060 [Nanoarchaeota archaeon]
MAKKRGQASMEYLLIVGFALIMLMPLVVIHMTQEENIRDDSNLMQATNIVQTLISNAESIHFIGEPSKTTIEVRMPQNVQEVEIEENRILFRVATGDGEVEVYRYTNVELTGSLDPNQGLTRITIEAQDDKVDISQK